MKKFVTASLALSALSTLTASGVGTVPIDISGVVDLRIQSIAFGEANLLPEGQQTFNGIPFNILEGSNTWYAGDQGTSTSITIDVTVGLTGVDKFYTLISTAWGSLTPNLAAVTFVGAQGAEVNFNLSGGVHIRDFIDNEFSNTISSPDTVGVFATSANVNYARYDMQTFDLGDTFLTEELAFVRFSDFGSEGVQRLLLMGATANVIPEPSVALSSLFGFAALLFVRRRT
jgi:hypothetical protein